MTTSTKPIWAADATTPAMGSLGSDVACDVCVIGAGIAGLTVAYELAGEGLNVVVLEGQHRIGDGETSATSAHLSDFIDDGYARVKAVRGAEAVGLAYQSHKAAIEKIETVARAEKIECGFRRVDGFLIPGADEKGTSIADEEKVCKEAKIPVTRAAPLVAGVAEGLKFPDQAQFQPRKYVAGLAAAARRRGAFVFTDTRVEDVAGGEPAVVTVKGGRKVTAKAVVVATNSPIQGYLRVNARIASYTSYLIALEIPADAVPPALVWDTEDPYHYARTQVQDDGTHWLVVGGEDHKTGQASDQAARWQRLEVWARAKYPQAGAVRYRWDGEILETLDGLALIGRDPGGAKNVYIVTGDSGMGLTHGTLAGLILPDMIAGRENRWADLYSPTRLPIMAARTLVGENLNVGRQLADWVTRGDTPAESDVAAGCGAVLRHGFTKVAVYRRDDGEACEMSAVCPHMGGIVRWNDADKTWDCPLHGSRFAADGKVFHGPAMTDLARHEPKGEAVPAEA